MSPFGGSTLAAARIQARKCREGLAALATHRGAQASATDADRMDFHRELGAALYHARRAEELIEQAEELETHIDELQQMQFRRGA